MFLEGFIFYLIVLGIIISLIYFLLKLCKLLIKDRFILIIVILFFILEFIFSYIDFPIRTLYDNNHGIRYISYNVFGDYFTYFIKDIKEFSNNIFISIINFPYYLIYNKFNLNITLYGIKLIFILNTIILYLIFKSVKLNEYIRNLLVILFSFGWLSIVSLNSIGSSGFNMFIFLSSIYFFINFLNYRYDNKIWLFYYISFLLTIIVGFLTRIEFLPIILIFSLYLIYLKYKGEKLILFLKDNFGIFLFPVLFLLYIGLFLKNNILANSFGNKPNGFSFENIINHFQSIFFIDGVIIFFLISILLLILFLKNKISFIFFGFILIIIIFSYNVHELYMFHFTRHQYFIYTILILCFGIYFNYFKNINKKYIIIFYILSFFYIIYSFYFLYNTKNNLRSDSIELNTFIDFNNKIDNNCYILGTNDFLKLYSKNVFFDTNYLPNCSYLWKELECSIFDLESDFFGKEYRENINNKCNFILNNLQSSYLINEFKHKYYTDGWSHEYKDNREVIIGLYKLR